MCRFLWPRLPFFLMLEPVLPASPAPGACSPCLACLGDQKGLEVCLKMKPLWASVFMMLAMFLQSSAERAQTRPVRATIRLGAAGLSSESHAGAMQLQAQPSVPTSPSTVPSHCKCPAGVWGECGLPSTAHLLRVWPCTALGRIHGPDLEACLGQWHCPGYWLTRPWVLLAAACPTARGEPVGRSCKLGSRWPPAPDQQLLPCKPSASLPSLLLQQPCPLVALASEGAVPAAGWA